MSGTYSAQGDKDKIDALYQTWAHSFNGKIAVSKTVVLRSNRSGPAKTEI